MRVIITLCPGLGGSEGLQGWRGASLQEWDSAVPASLFSPYVPCTLAWHGPCIRLAHTQSLRGLALSVKGERYREWATLSVWCGKCEAETD